MAAPASVLKAIRDAAYGRVGERAQVGAVQAELAKRGYSQLPTLQTFTDEGRTVRAYVWEESPAGGDLLLITGPSIEPTVRLATDEEYVSAPERGFFVPAHEAGKAALAKAHDAAARAMARVGVQAGPASGRGGVITGREDESWVRAPSPPSPSRPGPTRRPEGTGSEYWHTVPMRATLKRKLNTKQLAAFDQAWAATVHGDPSVMGPKLLDAQNAMLLLDQVGDHFETGGEDGHTLRDRVAFESIVGHVLRELRPDLAPLIKEQTQRNLFDDAVRFSAEIRPMLDTIHKGGGSEDDRLEAQRLWNELRAAKIQDSLRSWGDMTAAGQVDGTIKLIEQEILSAGKVLRDRAVRGDVQEAEIQERKAEAIARGQEAVDFKKIHGTSVKKGREFHDIYNDQLVDLFERETGLALSLGGKPVTVGPPPMLPGEHANQADLLYARALESPGSEGRYFSALSEYHTAMSQGDTTRAAQMKAAAEEHRAAFEAEQKAPVTRTHPTTVVEHGDGRRTAVIVGGDEPDDEPEEEGTTIESTIPPSQQALWREWSTSRNVSGDDLTVMLEAHDRGDTNQVLGHAPSTLADLDKVAERMGIGSAVTEPETPEPEPIPPPAPSKPSDEDMMSRLAGLLDQMGLGA